MNPLLNVPHDILFLLVQQLDIWDITRLCQTSKEMMRKIIPRVHQIIFPSNRIWRLEKKDKEREKEREKEKGEKEKDKQKTDSVVNLFEQHQRDVVHAYVDGLMQSQRKVTYDEIHRRYIRDANPSHYSLTLPPIYLLNQYPSLTDYTVPFLGSVSDLLDVDPASLVKIVNQCHELKFICTYPAVPMTRAERELHENQSFYNEGRSFSSLTAKYWTPLPSNGGSRSLHQRMKEWLVRYVLLYPDASLSIVIIPEKYLIQTQGDFELYFYIFSYKNKQVQTTLPFVWTGYIETTNDSDGSRLYSVAMEPMTGNTLIPVELWLSSLETVPTDNVEIEATQYSRYFNTNRDSTGICSFLSDNLPGSFRNSIRGKEGLSRNMWGPGVWESMHRMALDFDGDEVPTPSKSQLAMEFENYVNRRTGVFTGRPIRRFTLGQRIIHPRPLNYLNGETYTPSQPQLPPRQSLSIRDHISSPKKEPALAQKTTRRLLHRQQKQDQKRHDKQISYHRKSYR